jgi:uncharacterized ferritin-like protein (DUF455 family)
VELRAWAEAIVFGETLEEKLLQPGSFRDTAPGAALERVPELPGRARALRPSEARLEAPPLTGLEDPRARAHVLHSFANHELQALELQALALLRFPDAPAEFRQEIARVLVEEQSHLSLYLERCRELGLDLGEVGLSRYLWDALATMRQPLDYVTGMALTFEQANLDFARDYEERFRAAGDAASAAILRRVYEEEIGHVRLGTQWLGRWAPGEEDWDAYRRLLPKSLTPRRARGSGVFQREARLAAGLSEGFLAELVLAGGSRGRPPDLLWFRPGAERALTPGGPQTPPRSHQLLAADLSATLAFAARPDDLVLVPELPSLAWRQHLSELGLPQVEWTAVGAALPGRAAEIRGALQEALGERVLGRLRPWAWDPLARETLGPLGPIPGEAAPLVQLASKSWAAALLDSLQLEGSPQLDPGSLSSPLVVQERGQTCATLTEVERALTSRADASGWWVLKAPLASSGEGLRRLAPAEALDANLRGWTQRALRGGPLRVEPWHEREADLSLVFEVGPEGALDDPALTVFRTDARGRYRGHWVGPARRFLSPAALRLLHEARPDAGGARGLDLLLGCARSAAAALAARGYRGPAGIDALIARSDDGLRLHPLLEVNVRWTFGHLACALAKHLRRGRIGRWDLLPARDWQAAGCESASAYVARLEPARASEGLAGGALPTNDPAQATAVLGLLRIGRDLSALAQEPLRPQVEQEDRNVGRADA